MKKRLSLHLLLVLLAFSFFTLNGKPAINESEALKLYHEGNIAYQKLEYDKSIEIFNKLISQEYRSAEIYYNLGNAYFKKGVFSKAILNYERAKKIDPEDEDVNFNLKIASMNVVDKIEAAPQIFYKRWISKMSTAFSTDTWTIFFIVLIWLVFVASAMYITGSTVFSKKVSFFSLILFLLVSIPVGVLMLKSHTSSNVDQQAIVMTTSVYVKSSPDDKGNDLFILHEGAKADVLDEIGDWKKIRIANGSVGWMRGEEMEII